MCTYTETGNIKCSLSKIYETAIQIQENPRETEGKHNQNTKKNRREKKKNKEKHGKIGLTENVAYCVLPKRDPKPKHTKMGL